MIAHVHGAHNDRGLVGSGESAQRSVNFKQSMRVALASWFVQHIPVYHDMVCSLIHGAGHDVAYGAEECVHHGDAV